MFGAVLTVLAAVPGATGSLANYDSSSRWFTAKPDHERTVLQAALVLLGHYNGLIDGVFSKVTYRALVGFERSAGRDGDGVLDPEQEDQLRQEASEVHEALGISVTTDQGTGLRLPIPAKLFTTSRRSKWGTHWENADGGIELETLAIHETETTFASLYDRLKSSGDRSIDYDVAGRDAFVLSGRLDGRSFYTIFVRSRDTSFGISLAWSDQHDELGSVVAVLLASTMEVPQEGAGVGTQPPVSDDDELSNIGVSGSGFSISTGGLIVTNAHVVGGCQDIEVASLGPATIFVSDTERDLAVLRVANATTAAAKIQQRDLALGQAIVVLGYPLSPLMGNALAVSPGVVGSLTGLVGDASTFTIAGSIQPGNSGGPVLDMDGNVVGVAIAKFNEAVMLELAGTTGANIGFAVGAETLLEFLAPFRHEIADGQSPGEMSVQEVVATAEDFTHRIVCRD